MRCQVCGKESGKYPLCKVCNIKKGQGQIIKCTICNQWHYVNQPCYTLDSVSKSEYLYNSKSTLISKSEKEYFFTIQSALGENYCIFPQVNLASFIVRTDNSR